MIGNPYKRNGEKMIINNILDNIFSTWSNVAVLRVLHKVKVGLSGREIAKRSNMSPPSSLDALSNLENLNIVIRQRGGREHFFFLNREHYIVKKIIIPILIAEDNFSVSIYKELKEKLGKLTISLIIFGSVARKVEGVESDLDICIVYSNSMIKRKIELVVTEIKSQLFNKFGVSLSPFYITEKDFLIRLKKNMSPVNEIIKDGVVISGKLIREF